MEERWFFVKKVCDTRGRFIHFPHFNKWKLRVNESCCWPALPNNPIMSGMQHITELPGNPAKLNKWPRSHRNSMLFLFFFGRKASLGKSLDYISFSSHLQNFFTSYTWEFQLCHWADTKHLTRTIQGWPRPPYCYADTPHAINVHKPCSATCRLIHTPTRSSFLPPFGMFLWSAQSTHLLRAGKQCSKNQETHPDRDSPHAATNCRRAEVSITPQTYSEVPWSIGWVTVNHTLQQRNFPYPLSCMLLSRASFQTSFLLRW